MGSVALTVLGTGIVSGQDYPNKVIRIVTTGAGTGSDFTSRIVADGISGPLGQQVIVDNRASGVIPGEIVAKAPPDGYTLLVTGSTLWIGPFLQSTPYDPVRDFAPITLTDRSPSVVVVHPSVPAKSVKDLIALARARPGVLNYGSVAAGTAPHLAAELFKSMAGVDIVRVTYKSLSVAITDLVTGELQVVFPNPFSVVSHINSGRLRALAVTSAQPYALLPELPTVSASGLPGYEFLSITAIFAPAKTPAPVINRLNQEIVRVLNRDDVKEKILRTGAIAVGSSPEQLAAAVKSDMARMGKVIKDGGIKAD
jgi:tripartite-type tricarboxylate transporter receptor subunit TctC